MTSRNLSEATWRKSTYSGGATNCVEVAGNVMVGVRDSKNAEGSALTFAPGAWNAFTNAVKDGKYDKRLGLLPGGLRRVRALQAGAAAKTERGGHGGDAAGRFPRD